MNTPTTKNASEVELTHSGKKRNFNIAFDASVD